MPFKVTAIRSWSSMGERGNTSISLKSEIRDLNWTIKRGLPDSSIFAISDFGFEIRLRPISKCLSPLLNRSLTRRVTDSGLVETCGPHHFLRLRPDGLALRALSHRERVAFGSGLP